MDDREVEVREFISFHLGHLIKNRFISERDVDVCAKAIVFFMNDVPPTRDETERFIIAMADEAPRAVTALLLFDRKVNSR